MPWRQTEDRRSLTDLLILNDLVVVAVALVVTLAGCGMPRHVAGAPAAAAPVAPASPTPPALPATELPSAVPPALPAVPPPSAAPAAVELAPAPSAPLAPPPNHISSDNGAIDTGVGWYSDCSGRSMVPHGEAVIDTCVPGLLYLLGHNPGVFSGAFSLSTGSTLTYDDSNGAAHHYRVVSVRTIDTQRSVFPPPRVAPDVSLQLQTCVNISGSVVRLIDAASI